MVVKVVVASRYGSTREIGEAIANELRAAGHEARVSDASEVADLDSPDAVVMGSAVYMGRWLKAARNLLEARAEALGQRPLWLFSSGPTGEPPLPKEAEPSEVAVAAEELKARDHRVFPGKLDRSVLNRRERLVVRALRASEGDFRDWESIRGWAQSIAIALSESGPA
jgi:menaquinone-dependent protoporphyrinogen oxidase